MREYLILGIFDVSLVDTIMDVNQTNAERYMRKPAREEGIFWAYPLVVRRGKAHQIAKHTPNAVIVFIA